MSTKAFIVMRDAAFDKKSLSFSFPKANIPLDTFRSVAQVFIDNNARSSSTGYKLTSFDSAYYEETIRTDVIE